MRGWEGDKLKVVQSGGHVCAEQAVRRPSAHALHMSSERVSTENILLLPHAVPEKTILLSSSAAWVSVGA